MLGVSEFPQFRPQSNDLSNFPTIIEENGIFLPINYYPMQSPGYTVHWSKKSLQIVERIGETVKIVSELHIKDLAVKGVIFDVRSFDERRQNKNKNKREGIFKSLTSWLKNWSNSEIADENFDEISQIIPLMFERTMFDFLIFFKSAHKEEQEIYGVTRMRLLMSGNFKNIQRFDGIVPALLTDKNIKFINWKSFLIAISASQSTSCVKVKAVDLSSIEGDWKDVLSFDQASFEEVNVLICEDRLQERAVLVIQSLSNNQIELICLKEEGLKDLDVKRMDCDIASCSGPIACGYIENDCLYLIQGSNLLKISLDGSSDKSKIPEFGNDCVSSYLIPWRQDFKMASLLVNLKRRRSGLFYQISVNSFNEMISEIVLESELFENSTEIISIFVSSSLEIFLLDRSGKVQIYFGLLLASDWDEVLKKKSSFNSCETFEFSKWFNILGDFPFKSNEFYEERRTKMSLMIDKLLKSFDCKVEFPPNDWKSLGKACGILKELKRIEIILYYIFASSSLSTSLNLKSFYYQFGLKDKQVAFIEAAYFADHGDPSRASKIFCTRRMDIADRHELSSSIVESFTAEINNEQLAIFSLFSAGRLISFDILIEKRHMFNEMIKAILVVKGVKIVLEWFKGLFAWLRPDDKSALIPVGSLHQMLIRQFVNILLNLGSNSSFKHFAFDFIDYSFDSEMLKSILNHLSEEISSNDRAAWMLTMICASRGKLYKYLVDFEFGGLVRDEEVLKGIEEIKEIVRPLLEDQLLNCDYEDEDEIEEVFGVNVVDSDRASTPIINCTGGSSTPRSSGKKLNIYARSPNLNNNNKSRYNTDNIGSSPTFTPRHYPPKKPTTLSEQVRGDVATEKIIGNPGGVKRVRDELIEMNYNTDTDNDIDNDNDNNNDIVLLTKQDSIVEFEESVITIVEDKQRSKRRKRSRL